MRILLLALLLSGCASVPQTLNQNLFYKRDMDIEVNGFKGEGVLVVPLSEVYKFDITSSGKLDLFTFESCHREESKEKAGQGGLFGDRKRVKLDYKPNPGIEDQGGCPVRLGGYEQDKGRHSWAFIDFETKEAKLPAVVKCNGSTWNSRGVTVCQSKAGLLQEIDFPVEVIVNPDPGCPMERPADLKKYSFKISLRECVYNFMEKQAPHREHRLTTVGYESILIREN